MKYFIYLYFLFFSISACLGQSYNFLETFNGDFNFQLITVKRDCFNCTPIVKDEKVVQYNFNKVKSILTDSTFYKGSLSGIGIRKYENVNLASYKSKGTWFSTSNVGDFGMTWDSTITTYRVDYQYKNGQLINEKTFDGQTERLTTEVIYTYDKNGKLIQELIKDYPDPDYFLTFKPNSTEAFYDKDELRYTTRKKVYTYNKDRTSIEFFKTDSLTGIQTIIKSLNETKTILKDTNGKLRSEVIKKTNQLNQIVKILTTENGYDGFGYGYDYTAYNKQTFKYDSLNRLLKRYYFNNGKMVMIDSYSYDN